MEKARMEKGALGPFIFMCFHYRGGLSKALFALSHWAEYLLKVTLFSSST
jgi:hypothetical protein